MHGPCLEKELFTPLGILYEIVHEFYWKVQRFLNENIISVYFCVLQVRPRPLPLPL